MGRRLRLQGRAIARVSLFVDASVWSLALRRDAPESTPEVTELRRALRGDIPVLTTGLVLQELLQGFRGPRARDATVERFAALPCLQPERRDHLAAADLRNDCRLRGFQLGTIDALLAQLCIRCPEIVASSQRGRGNIGHTPDAGGPLQVEGTRPIGSDIRGGTRIQAPTEMNSPDSPDGEPLAAAPACRRADRVGGRRALPNGLRAPSQRPSDPWSGASIPMHRARTVGQSSTRARLAAAETAVSCPPR